MQDMEEASSPGNMFFFHVGEPNQLELVNLQMR